jgi:energy-converting hydrogenase A subunit R
MRIFITDCEGPITKNDNAFELCSSFIPGGDLLFRTLSRYDDYLALEGKIRDYEAGFTLRLVMPFLLAYGLDVERMFRFSFESLSLMPRAIEAMRFLRGLMPLFVISTSYQPYLKALAGLIGLPFECIVCTKLSIGELRLEERIIKRLREIAQWIISLGEIEHFDLEIINRLNEVFFKEFSEEPISQIMRSVHPIGSKGKRAALREIAKKTGSSLEEVLYVGDSITDCEALREVRLSGGLALAFNPNRYALQEAEVVCLSEDASPLVVFGYLFLKGGKEEVIKAVTNWNEEYLLKRGVPPEWLPTGEVGLIERENLEFWSLRSEDFRKRVRGVKIGELG